MSEQESLRLAMMLQQQENDEYEVMYGNMSDDGDKDESEEDYKPIPKRKKSKSKSKPKSKNNGKGKGKGKRKRKNCNEEENSSKADLQLDKENNESSNRTTTNAIKGGSIAGKKRKRDEFNDNMDDGDDSSNKNENENENVDLNSNKNENLNGDGVSKQESTGLTPPAKKRRKKNNSKSVSTNKTSKSKKTKKTTATATTTTTTVGKGNWTEEEETKFEEGLEIYGRDWDKVREHMGTNRVIRNIKSHAQTYFVKLLRDEKPLPDKVKETGDGYTPSGKPLNVYGAKCKNIIGDASKVPRHLGGVISDEEGANKLKKKKTNKNKENSNDSTTKNENNTDKLTKKGKGTKGAKGKAKGKGKGKGKSKGKLKGRGRGRGKNDSSDSDDSECGNWNPSGGIKNDGIFKGTLRRSTRQRTNKNKKNEDMLNGDDQYELRIDIEKYKQKEDLNIKKKELIHDIIQPFDIIACPNALLIADLHGHLCRNVEIMGYLSGYYDKENSIVYILKCYPLREENQTTKSVTAETMDIFRISNIISKEYCIINGKKKQLRLLGWYHSHPEFENYPSNQDLFTHSHQKQNSLNSDDCDSPFVGLILQSWSSFGKETEYRWFNTIRDETGDFIPMEFEWKRKKYTNINDPLLLQQIKDLIIRYSDEKYSKERSNLGTIWKTFVDEIHNNNENEQQDKEKEKEKEKTNENENNTNENENEKENEKEQYNSDEEEQDYDIDLILKNKDNNKNKNETKDNDRDCSVKIKQTKVTRFEKVIESLRHHMIQSVNENGNENGNENDNNNDDMSDNFVNYVTSLFYDNIHTWWKGKSKPTNEDISLVKKFNENNKIESWIGSKSSIQMILNNTNDSLNDKKNEEINEKNEKNCNVEKDQSQELTVKPTEHKEMENDNNNSENENEDIDLEIIKNNDNNNDNNIIIEATNNVSEMSLNNKNRNDENINNNMSKSTQNLDENGEIVNDCKDVE